MSKVLLATLEERISANGVRRLSGKLGTIRLKAVPQQGPACSTWRIYGQGSDRESSIHLATVHESTGPDGGRYLTGRFGLGQIMVVSVGEGRTIWNVYVVDPGRKLAQAAHTHMRDETKRRHGTSANERISAPISRGQHDRQI